MLSSEDSVDMWDLFREDNGKDDSRSGEDYVATSTQLRELVWTHVLTTEYVSFVGALRLRSVCRSWSCVIVDGIEVVNLNGKVLTIDAVRRLADLRIKPKRLELDESAATSSKESEIFLLRACAMWGRWIETLSLNHFDASDAVIAQALSCCSRLRTVQIAGTTRISSRTIRELSSSERHTRLEHVNVATSCNRHSDHLEDRDIQCLLKRKRRHLRALNVSGHAQLSTAAFCTSFQSDDDEDECGLSNIAAEHVCLHESSFSLIRSHAHTLRVLNLYGICIDASSSENSCLTHILELRSLRSLGLGHVQAENFPLDIARRLATSLPHLESLDLTRSDLWKLWVSNGNERGDSVNFPSLQCLWLRSTTIDDNGLADVVLGTPALLDLDIGQCPKITDRGVAVVASTIGSLRRLYVDVNPVSDSRHVMRGTGLDTVLRTHGHRIHSLDFAGHVSLDPSSIASYATYLRRLNLSHLGCRLDSVVRALVTKCMTLVELTIDRCNVTSETLLHLATRSRVRKLSIAGCVSTSDDVVIALARRGHLEELNVSTCSLITTKSILSDEMRRNHELRRLNLRECPLISTSAIQKLRRALYDCVIEGAGVI